jgi:hypothetical protein
VPEPGEPSGTAETSVTAAARATAETPASGETHGQRLLVIYLALMLAMLLAALDQMIVSTALPTIVNDLGGLSRVVTAYMLASTATTQVWGKPGHVRGDVFPDSVESNSSVLAGWSPDQHAELENVLAKLSRAILGDEADRHLI